MATVRKKGVRLFGVVCSDVILLAAGMSSSAGVETNATDVKVVVTVRDPVRVAVDRIVVKAALTSGKEALPVGILEDADPPASTRTAPVPLVAAAALVELRKNGSSVILAAARVTAGDGIFDVGNGKTLDWPDVSRDVVIVCEQKDSESAGSRASSPVRSCRLRGVDLRSSFRIHGTVRSRLFRLKSAQL
jgi:hypothetical protein